MRAKKNSRGLTLSALAVIAAAVAPAVRAQTTSTWTGSGPDGLWTDTANWDINVVPVSGSAAAFLDIPGGFTNVDLGGAAQPINTILFAGTNTSYTLGVSSGDAFNFDANGAVTVNSTVNANQFINANLNTNGSMTVTNNAVGAGLFLSGNIVVNGGGVLTVTSSTDNSNTTLSGNISDAGGTGSVAYVMNTATTTTNTNLIITGNNTYSGTTVIQVNTGGTAIGGIQIGSNTAFGTGKVINIIATGGSNSPQYQAIGGTRTLANAFDLSGGIIFGGNNGFVFTGPITVINSASNGGRTLNDLISNGSALVLGASTSSASVINLGNPISNGGDGVGKSLTLTAGPNANIIINDVMQNPGTGAGSVSYSEGVNAIINVNSLNTYSGSTIFNGTGTAAIQFNHSFNTGDPSGPFGIGTLVFNNTSNNTLQPIEGDRVLANPVQLTFGFTIGNAGGDSSSLTFTGPMSLVANGRTLSNNMFSPAVLTLGAATNPSTITLAAASGQTLQFGGAGNTVINDSFLNSGTFSTTVNFNGTGSNIVNGALATGGVVSIGGNGQNLTFNNSPINLTSLTIGGGANSITNFNVAITGSGSVTSSAAGLVNFNVTNTYTGGTLLSGGGTIIPIKFSSSGTSGVFGTGAITFNNSSNQHLQPVGNQVIDNPLTLITGFAMENTLNDSSSLTFTGPITMQTATRTISNGFNVALGTNGGALVLGASPDSAFLTLPSPTNGASQGVGFIALTGPIVINDIIRDGTSTAGVVTYNTNNGDIQNVTINGDNTYSGNTSIGAQTNGAGTLLLGVSSVVSGTSIISGPFGKGTLTMNQPATSAGALPPTLTPIGADRTVANAIVLTGGFYAQNSATAAFNLSLTGSMTLGTNSRAITNNLVAGTALNLGTGTSISTISLASALQLQSTISNSGPTVINDLVQDNGTNSGSILVTSGLTQLTNAGNTYTGGSTVNGGVLSVSSDGNLGNAAGVVNIGAGTLLSTGTFTTARSFSLTDASNSTLDATGTNTLTLSGTMTDAGSINKGTNAGTVQLVLPGGYNANNNVNVLGGTLAVGDPVNGVTGPLNIPGTLSVSDGTPMVLLPATGMAVTHTINSLNLNTTGKLDIGNSSFYTTTSTSTIQSYLKAGYNGGAWNGSGAAIVSTSANLSSGSSTRSLGYASSTDSVAGSVIIPAGQTLVKYTTPGDADLSGNTDFNDFLALQNAYNKPGNWSQGDFDYTGTVDFNDFLILQNNYNHSLNANGTVAGGGAGAAKSALAKASSLTASPSVPTATVTYVLSPNDDGHGNNAPGKFAVYAIDSTADGNHGMASFSVDVQGATLVTNFAPKGTYDDGTNTGNTVAEGFTLLRTGNGAFSTLTDPAKSSQDTVDASGVQLIYGMGQLAGNLNSQAPAGSSGGTGKVQPTYAAELLVMTGTFSGSSLAFNTDMTFDKANVFLTGSTADTEAAGITLTTAGVPEPTTLSLMALAAGGLLGRRKRKQR